MTNKKTIFKVSSAALALSIGFTVVAPTASTFAATTDTTEAAPSPQTIEQVKNFKPSQKAMDFMSKVVKSGAINEFNYSSDFKTMSYKHDMNTIKATYNFNDEDIAQLDYIVNFYNESMKNSTVATETLSNQNMNPITKGVSTYVNVDYGWTWIKLGFSNAEMKLFLVEAAMAGPYALYAAFVGLSAITSTPVGAAIIGVLGAIGLPSFASICQTIIRANVAGKGINVEAGLDGVIPYITASVARH
ncbi:hypothetical protein [Bacillus cereus]|uniref:hypothetical protein n=1 Tax=Bacillus cereus TaxID=1396 RepID=UPI0015D4DCCE|nr:hypothetical protein [Bacillus cereus]